MAKRKINHNYNKKYADSLINRTKSQCASTLRAIYTAMILIEDEHGVTERFQKIYKKKSPAKIRNMTKKALINEVILIEKSIDRAEKYIAKKNKWDIDTLWNNIATTGYHEFTNDLMKIINPLAFDIDDILEMGIMNKRCFDYKKLKNA